MSITDWVQLGTAVGTAGLAVAAFRQLRWVRSQIAATREATEAAVAGVREATRARVDDIAPIVTLYPEPPSLTPLVDRNRSGMPSANDLRLLDAASIHRSEVPDKEWVFPEAKSWFLWFCERAVIVNEGETTARVRVEGEARFVTGTSPLFSDLGELAVPPPSGSAQPHEHLLRPGSAAMIEWGSGHSLERWARAHSDQSGTEGRMTLIVSVFSAVGEGIVDKLYLEVGAQPIEPVPGKDSHWRIVEDLAFSPTVHPTQRYYLAEGWDPRKPPWAERAGDAGE